MHRPLETLYIHVFSEGNFTATRKLVQSLHDSYTYAVSSGDTRLQTKLRVRILDNGSIPESADLLKDFVKKESALWNEDIVLHRLVLPKGWALAHLELLKAHPVPSGFVLFLKSGVSVPLNFFSALCEFLSLSPDVTRIFVPAINTTRRFFYPDSVSRLGYVVEYVHRRFSERLGALSSLGFMAPARLFVESGLLGSVRCAELVDAELSLRALGMGWSMRGMSAVHLFSDISQLSPVSLTSMEDRLYMINTFAIEKMHRLTAKVQFALELLYFYFVQSFNGVSERDSLRIKQLAMRVLSF